MIRRALVLSSVVTLTACGMDMDHGALPAAVPMIVPEPWTGSLSVPVLPDDDPASDVVSVALRAAPAEVEYLPGRRVEVWAFNGSVPGPTIEARVGQRVRVRFTNNLPEPTTIHWHGLRVANAMDGTARVMQPVPSGGTFEYELLLPDAGTFWYHPHVRSDVQVEKGLYGAIVVRDPSEPTLPVASEEVLVLDDVRVDPTTGALDEGEDERAEMMGREGNLFLVNGRRSNATVSARAGEARRWRFVNAANARYVDLALEGGRMVRVASDAGLLQAPAETQQGLLLVPGERADVIVWLERPGDTAILRARPYERAMGAGRSEPVDLVRLVADGAAALPAPALPASLRSIPALVVSSEKVQSVRLGERMGDGRMEFTINGRRFPDVPPLATTRGAVETWEIVNGTEMDHPFHLHGFRFQPEGVREWKDTINVPASRTVRLTVEIDARDGAAGTWMYHCHILEHAENGMIGELDVR